MNKFTAVMMVFSLAAWCQAGITNLVVNGGFEDTAEQMLTPSQISPAYSVTGWRAFNTATEGAVTYRVVTDPSSASDGSNYLEIDCSSSEKRDAGFDVHHVGAGASAISPGTAYTVSFDAKRVSGDDNALQVAVKTYEGSAAILESLMDTNLELSDEWTSYSFTIVPTRAMPDGSDPNLYIGFRPRKGTFLQRERICIDHVSVIPSDVRPDSVRLFNVFTDNMVLQRNARVAVYGAARPGDQVAVSFADQSKTSVADGEGKWLVHLDPMPASFKPRTLSVTSERSGETSISNVLVGDVWLAGGQSNMDHPFRSYSLLTPPEKTNPNLRILVAAKVPSVNPLDQLVLEPVLKGTWQSSSSYYLEGFSPSAYYFGSILHEELNVPVGLIESAWGATIAEAWTPAETLEALGYAEKEPIYKGGELGRNNPSVLYNGMIYPLRHFTFKGVIWYQGESNSPQVLAYESLFSGMISAWRETFDNEDLPFYFVQLAPYQTLGWNKNGAAWAWLREAQTRTLALPNTGMAVITDAGEYLDIHPQWKQVVGERLALHALQAEGLDVVASSPMYSGMTVDGNQIVLNFSKADSGLETREVVMNRNRNLPKGEDPEAFRVPASKVAGFKICGADRKFVEANAVIRGNQVFVSSPQVPTPVAVRYGWGNFPLCNLYSKSGLPVCPFRTDNFPPPNFDGAQSGELFSGDVKALGTPMKLHAGTKESPVALQEKEGRAVSYISEKAGSKSRYGYYKSKDHAVRNGKNPEVKVQVLYFDQGEGSFSLVYDSSDSSVRVNPKSAGAWKFSGMKVMLADSRTWRVATITLKDAFFGGRCNGADLRIQSTDTNLFLGGVFLSSLTP
ncbi:sialate O-acetylesterase [Tichowtungia aerotolerans]|uniref:Sialate O-acetylesterase n=1 Tax=Tichowtungia aerotolerans TaxID=2697043 RepID=A0A6P1M742_9BACT|nr:sialate O-acetylesterase [Tichowtungia aerotolerans]QHI68008.1 hypothetical protein GT409_00600 [Tichowtungia aerotolerans]